MRLARVLGPVWGARHASALDGVKLLEVQTLTTRGGVVDATGAARLVASEATTVVVDGLGAGPGELVLIAHGSRVRDLTVGAQVADKDVVVAIVDDYQLAERVDRGAK